MRVLRIVLTLVFGLVVAGPETHACPVHSPAPVRSHHQNHQTAKGHCTCPQACCPAGVAVAMPATTRRWIAVPRPVVVVAAEVSRPLLLPARKHLLPLALAPPLVG